MSQSHTATEQWQSFELRMRRRRFDRCVLRAAAALDAEFLDAAKEAIEEAERLSFEDPDVAELKARLQALEALEGAALHPDVPGDATEPVPVSAPAPVEAILTPRATAAIAPPAVQAPVAAPSPAQANPARRLAPAAALVLAASAAGWAIIASDLPSRVQPALAAAVNWLAAQRTTLSTSVSAPAPKATVPPEDAPRTAAAPAMATEPVPDIAGAPPPAADPAASDAVNTEPSRAATTAGTAGSTAAPPAAAAPVERSAPPASAPAREVVTERPAAAIAARTPESTAAPPAPVPAAVPPPVRVAAGADSLAARVAPVPLPSVPVGPALALPTLPAAPAPAPAPSPAPPADASISPAAAAATNERLVRATLTRYEAAYSGLDAAAARAVWPSVDHRALARAFDGLASQRFSLERCDIRLNGGSAQADCSGRAQWTPKVGGGAQTASRRWQFELKQNNGDWVIVRASVR